MAGAVIVKSKLTSLLKGGARTAGIRAEFDPKVAVRVTFDIRTLERKMETRNRKVLTRTGAVGRTIMRRLLGKKRTKRNPGASQAASGRRSFRRRQQAGEPPRKVSGALQRFVLFGVDMNSRSVVVGPTLFPGSKNTTRPRQQKTTPRLLERGGPARILTRAPGRTSRQRGLFRRWKSAKFGQRPWIEETRRRTIPQFIKINAQETLK